MGLTIDDTKLKELRRKSLPKKGEGGGDLSVPVRGVARNTALRISSDTGAVPGNASSASSCRGRASPSIRSSPGPIEQFDNQPERWVDLAWDTNAAEQRFPARLMVSILNEVGSLAQVAQVISDLGGNIDALQMQAREGARDFFDAA